MPSAVERLKSTLAELQRELDSELDERRAALRYRLERGRVTFEREIRDRHRAARVGWAEFLRATRPAVVLSAPVIYSLIVPFLMLDLWVSLYQRVCFPIYGIARVRRSDYIMFDQRHLAYLNGLQKVNCLYCSYCNGLIAYVREIAGRTEQYWCPIKHARRMAGPHEHYLGFAEYGDADAYLRRSEPLRKDLRPNRD
jgi:hypothetical protein